MRHVVIIGNGIAGVSCARYVRKYSDHKITVISAETPFFFSRTALMYVYMGHMQFSHTKPYEDFFWRKNRIGLLHDEVVEVSFASKRLKLRAGGTLSYDDLVIASGSTPRRMSWPGVDLPGVQSLYSYQDLSLMERNTKGIGKAVVVGGGLIGIEMAEMLRSRGIAVSYLVREKSFWCKILPQEESQMINRHIKEHHVDLHLSAALKEIRAKDGRVCGVISVCFVRSIYWMEGQMTCIKHDMIRAVTGGGMLILMLFLLPQLRGEGYAFITTLLQESEVVPLSSFSFFVRHGVWMGILLVLALIFFKPIATSITIDAGGGGGIFAPSLFVGGVMGYLYALVLSLADIHVSASNMILMGMCGVLSGTQHAPLTAIFLIAEITGGYTLFLPLMIVSSVSYSIAHYFERHSFYVRNLIFKEKVKPYDKDQKILSQMDPRLLVEQDLHTTKPTHTIDELVAIVRKSTRNLFPVLDGNERMVGMLTLDDVRHLIFHEEKRKKVLVRDLMKRPKEKIDISEGMTSIMEKFERTQSWNLPVLKDGKYVGFISKSRILNAYRSNLSTRVHPLRHSAPQDI